MKCPKCGFNSFEYYDSCKRCSSDLTGYKLTYSITPLVLPIEAIEKLAAESRAAENMTDRISDSTETNDDIFSFDLPDEPQTAPVSQNDDPFNFDEPAPVVNQSMSSKAEDDVFADLLESTSQSDESPFAAAKSTVITTPAASKSAGISSGSGEFDLESFSWDDTPAAPEASTPDSTKAADDFDSLFGDTKENNSK